jgi:hypothetical protein
MATEAAPTTVNGTGNYHYTTPDAYNAASQPASSSSATTAQTTDAKPDITKDEVGWFFVEQYYTTLSRSPEKLHLFYSRKSQFVSGLEAEKVPVAIGQKVCSLRP